MYLWLLYLHIFSVILAIGPYFILLMALPKMRTATDEQLQSYVGIFRNTVWMTKHAGHLLIISGFLLVWVGNWPYSTSWIVLALVVLFSALYFIMRAFSPVLKKLETHDIDRNLAVQKLTRATWMYLIVNFIVIWLMVMKPQIW